MFVLPFSGEANGATENIIVSAGSDRKQSGDKSKGTKNSFNISWWCMSFTIP